MTTELKEFKVRNPKEEGSLQWRRSQVEEQLACLGYSKGDDIYLRLIPTMEGRHPRVMTIKANDLPIAKLVKLEGEGYNVFITYNGGGHSKSEVQWRRAFVSESDNTTIEEQLTSWYRKGLPQPTLMINSGNKSIHMYWCLHQAVKVDEHSNRIQSKIINRLDSDQSMLKAEQPLRLAGFRHPKTGKFTECIPLIHEKRRMIYTLVDMEVSTKGMKELPIKSSHKQGELLVDVKPSDDEVDVSFIDYIASTGDELKPTTKQAKLLNDEVRKVKEAVEGSRSNTLNEAAFVIGKIGGKHNIDVVDAATKMCEAFQGWENLTKTTDTFERAFNKGRIAGVAERTTEYQGKVDEYELLYNIDRYNPVRFNAQFIGDNIDITKSGVHIVISAMGTGKTRMLQQLAGRNGIVSLTYRRTLEYAQTRDIEDSGLGLTSVNKGQDTNAQVACTDSILKLYSPSETKYLLLDEFSDTLEHTLRSTGTTVKDRRTEKFEALANLIKGTPTVVVCGADLTTLEIDFIMELRDDVTVYHNTYTAPNEKPLRVAKTKNELITRINGDVGFGVPVYISTDSKNKCRVISSLIRETFPSTRLLEISADTSELAEVIEFLRDPSKESVNYNVVVASPTAATGVDISGTHFKVVYAYWTNWGLNYKGLIQGVSRVRNPEGLCVYLERTYETSNKEGEAPYVDIADAQIASHVTMTELFNKMVKRHELLRTLTTIKHMTNTLCTHNGFFLDGSDDATQVDDFATRLKRLEVQYIEDYIKSVLDAPMWGDNDVARYRAARVHGTPVTMEDVYAEHKYRYTQQLNQGEADYILGREDIEFAINGGVGKLWNFSRSLKWNRDMVEACDYVDQWWDKKEQVFHLDRNRHAERTRLIRTVIESSGCLEKLETTDKHGVVSYTYKAVPFTTESISGLLENIKGYEGFTRDIGKSGNTIKTDIGLLKTVLDAVGLELTDKRARNSTGKQVRMFEVSWESLDKMNNLYYSPSKYPWDRVCKHAVLTSSPRFQDEVSDFMRATLHRVKELGIKTGYYNGTRRAVV